MDQIEIHAIIFGATGHIGQGVLIECLEHPSVKSVLVIGRNSCGREHEKLREIIHSDYLDYSAIEKDLAGYNACYFCLGISSVGKSEEEYTIITHDYAVKAAEVLSSQNRNMTFCFISGAGTDEKEKSRMMWARVKGKSENALREFPFKQLYLMRPAFIQPMKGVQSRMKLYKVMGPLYPLLRRLFPNAVTNTVEVGLAMINAVLLGYDKQILENSDIIKLARKQHG
jgi:uncharacterized protein YbjT (DUF2867 family)